MRGLLAAGLVAGCYSPTPPAGAPCPDGICPSGLVCSPATRTCETTAIDASVTDDTFVDSPDGAVSPFRFRRRLTIHNNTNAALATGFTIRVPAGQLLGELIAKGSAKADLSDVRVIGDGALGERDRIVDNPVTGPAPGAISFALAAPLAGGATTTAYAIYYGNAAAGAPPAKGAMVFPVFDDFTAGIANTWLVHDAPTTSGGQLVLRANHTDALSTTAATDGVPITSAVEVVATVMNPQSEPTVQPEGTFFYWFGYQHTGDFSASDPWAIWIARGKGAVHAEQKSPVGCEMSCDGPQATQNTSPHYYVVERDPNATRFLLDGALSFSATVTNSTDYSVMVRNFMATSDVRVDYIRARARVTPDPTVQIGAEEAL